MNQLKSILMLGALSAGIAAAQITGEIRGIVTDPSGAAAARAKVTLKSVETGLTRTLEATEEGRFSFPLLNIGAYDVSAESAGFRVSTARAAVATGEVTTVQLRLEVGQVTETVTVSDAVATLDVENAQIQRSVVGEEIQLLPVGRNPNLIAVTAPGVAPVSANNPFLGSGSFNSNGGRGRGNNITVDGITATDVSVTGTGGPLGPLNFSSIKEVKVITNNFTAEYGRNSSSQVLYITGNGTNDFHGELFHQFQNDKLNARPFFDRSGKTNIVRDNQYGWSLNGPVYIPGLFDGRNKLFWLQDYQGTKTRGAGAAVIARVPTPAQLASVTDPTARALVQQYQLPSDPSGTLQQSAPTTTDAYQVGFKVNYNISDSDQVWGRYSQQRSTANSSGLTFIGSNLANFGASSANFPRQMTLQETHTFSPSLINEARFGYGRSEPAFPINSSVPLGPRITFADGSINSFGVWEGLPQGRAQSTFEFNDTISYFKGRHNFKGGVQYFHLRADSFFDALQRPLLRFANWDAFASGTPAVFQQRFGDSVRNNRVNNAYFFFQDDFKVSRNLTLNFGLRMEFAGGPREANDILSNLNLNNQTSFGAAGSGPFGLLELGGSSFQSNYNWGPRFGFAYSLGADQKMVIRGGYGIAYDFVFLNPITNQRFLPPFIVNGDLTGGFTGSNSFANLVAGNATVQSENRALVGQLATNVLNFGTISPAIDQGLSNAQVQQFNLGLQREMMGGVVLKAGYVGTKGNFLPRTSPINFIQGPAAASSEADETARRTEFTSALSAASGSATRRSNRIDGRYNGINYVTSAASSIFHSLQLEATKRMRNNYAFNVNYTYGKSIDNGSDVLGVLINDSANAQNNRNWNADRGPSQFDLQQRLVIVNTYSLPFFKSASNGMLRTLLGGWNINGITTFRSGFPVTFLAGARRGVVVDTLMDGTIRPNASGPINFVPLPISSAGSYNGRNTDPLQPISSYAASLGLSQPLLGNFGGLGRGVNRLNGERNFDISFGKDFVIREGLKVAFRADMFNLFNNTSFQDVDRNISSPTFGNYTTTGQLARQIWFTTRLVF